MNLRTSCELSRNIPLHGIVANVCDRKHATFGTFYETGPLDEARDLRDPRTIAPGPTLAACGGVRLRL